MQSRGILVDGSTEAGDPRLLLQIFGQPAIGPVFFEFIQRKKDEGFGEGNFTALFKSMEADQLRRGTLKVEESGEITPYGDPAFVASYLTALAATHDNILMVSHLPLVGYLVQSLCPAAGAPMFATSGLACIEWQDGKGALLWLEGPHTIR